MPDRSSKDFRKLLTDTPIRIETPYGLIIELREDGSLDVRVAHRDTRPTTPPTDPPAYSEAAMEWAQQDYHLWPCYQTSCVFYARDWECSPTSNDGQVMFSKLKELYTETWCRAHRSWVDKLNRAYVTEGCNQPGSKQEPFPNPQTGSEWFLEGILLGCWLVLQPSVNSVICEAGQPRVLLQKGNLATALQEYL